jgi:hypothetical protein
MRWHDERALRATAGSVAAARSRAVLDEANHMTKILKRMLTTAFLLFAGGSMTVVAVAESPHFVGTPTCTKSLSSGLTCSGKAAGLGSGPVAAFLTASSVTQTFNCVNKGGNIAPGQPVVTQNVTGPTQQITPHNGQITFSPTIPPPTPPSPSTECPNGNWSLKLTSLTFTGVVLHVQEPPGTDVLVQSFGTIDP